MAKVVTNEVRFSYAHLWEPQAVNGSEPKYSVSLIIPKTDKTTIKAIKDAIEIAKQEGIGKFGGKLPANLKLPLRDGDIERPDDETYKDSYFINCNSKDQPQIVDRKVQPISKVLGTAAEREAALETEAEIYVINRENVDWLVSNHSFSFDMIVIDELSSFKSYQSKRFKALRKVRPLAKRVVGLTGTPTPNGLMDLWAEINILDMGERLGRFITRYREAYFKPDKRNGMVIFSYKPLPEAERLIFEKISDICISMKAVDFLTMPERIDNRECVH